jgi:plasmid stability protein
MTNLCIRLPEKTYHNARVWAALHHTTVTDLVRYFLQNLAVVSAAKLGVPSARSAAVPRATPPAAARDIVSALPIVTFRFSDDDPAPAPRPAP